RRVFDAERREFPPEVEGRVLSDTTRFIKVRIGTVVENGVQALLVVTVLLLLFMNWRLALLVAIGIPISFAGALIVLEAGGYTINLLSLFGMIMALGKRGVSPAFYRIFDTLILSPLFARGGLGGMPFALPTI
ncbi:MAG: efflux RND transporter permease subunit, partial [Verrucomicrobia bacterium]|nr:efflux RND transporter permease subunit [Verrucomicrobiota bacterium]